jgi:hypothetical protein
MDDTPEEDEILQHLQSLNSGGVYVFYGHAKIGADKDGVGVTKAYGLSSKSGKLVKAEDMNRSLSSDKNPPTLVVLGGCQTSSLLEGIKQSGVPIAIGIEPDIAVSIASQAVQTLMQELQKGSTFEQALTKANRPGQGGVGMVAEWGAGYDPSMTLEAARKQHIAELHN